MVTSDSHPKSHPIVAVADVRVLRGGPSLLGNYAHVETWRALVYDPSLIRWAPRGHSLQMLVLSEPLESHR